MFLHHVRETAQKLIKWFNWHITGFNQSSKYGLCRILSDNFHIGICRNTTTYSVQILEKLEGNGRTVRNTLEAFIISRRRQFEKNMDAEAEDYISLWLK